MISTLLERRWLNWATHPFCEGSKPSWQRESPKTIITGRRTVRLWETPWDIWKYIKNMTFLLLWLWEICRSFRSLPRYSILDTCYYNSVVYEEKLGLGLIFRPSARFSVPCPQWYIWLTMPKAIRAKTRLSRLARDLETPYSQIGASVAADSIFFSGQNDLPAVLPDKGDVATSKTGQDRRPKCSTVVPPCRKNVLTEFRRLLQEDEEFSFPHRFGSEQSKQDRILSRGQRKRREKRDKLLRKTDFMKFRQSVLEEEERKSEVSCVLHT